MPTLSKVNGCLVGIPPNLLGCDELKQFGVKTTSEKLKYKMGNLGTNEDSIHCKPHRIVNYLQVYELTGCAPKIFPWLG